MDLRDHNPTTISNNDSTSYTISNFEVPPSTDNTSSAQSYVSYNSRMVRRRKSQRVIRHRLYAIYQFRRLPVQVTNNPFVDYIFNGSPTFN
jgi:hypothetical protein